MLSDLCFRVPDPVSWAARLCGWRQKLWLLPWKGRSCCTTKESSHSPKEEERNTGCREAQQASWVPWACTELWDSEWELSVHGWTWKDVYFISDPCPASLVSGHHLLQFSEVSSAFSVKQKSWNLSREAQRDWLTMCPRKGQVNGSGFEREEYVVKIKG